MRQKNSGYKDGRIDLEGLCEILRPANDTSRGELVNVWVQLVLLGKRNSALLSMPEWQKCWCPRDFAHSSLPWP